jgi:hypothetical protein
VEAGRARVRELLAGFAVHRSTFASMVPGPQDAAECRRRAQAVEQQADEVGARGAPSTPSTASPSPAGSSRAAAR